MFDGLEIARLRRLDSRSASFENPTGAPRQGGSEASQLGPGRKGRPWQPLEAGANVDLMTAEGNGQVRHIWITVPPSVASLRGLVLSAWWDGAEYPSVECPLGDFFGVAHGRTRHFFNAMQAEQEGAGLNSYFPMPFASGARINLRNDGPEKIDGIYYSVDYTLGDEVDDDTGRFHAAFRRENPTAIKKDFQILPERHGRGRFLGCTVGVRTLERDWWGEGEFKVYKDGDTDLPTICGTGTEDYIGAAWGVGQHFALYGGAPMIVADASGQRLISFYRFHVADPIYFQKQVRVDMQQIGIAPGDWNIGERADDWSAAAFWYQDGNEPLQPLPSFEERTAGLETIEGETGYQRIGL